ncbi:SDR family oxidoreductase [Leifsonia sp. H3M29-4]|uniref:SDR family NAD(P)-dependent oxidoreductase n=1 Tax=Salinibacterium metalliresistens TaxID=3031321 RepID=UPI0023DC19C6|nr:SDR family oxidoreductase [Salinibacterium metalliresistens]MDF1478108.1 SDR family oxidoreductase [Salinibacterium metalliresistens]
MNTQQTHQHPVAVVTGASAGIGRSAAIEIARRGTGVVATYRSRPEEAEETVALVREGGGRARALRLDVGLSSTFPDFRAELADVLEAEWGTDHITALVNNAGFGGGRAFEEMTEEDFDRYFRVLLHGPYFLAQSLLPMIADGGSVVSVSSSSVRSGETEAGYSGYAGMKAGLIVASRYLAKELSPRGIRVNTIAPGPTRTRISDDAFEKYPEIIDGIAAKTALGRIGEPDDIGKVIAFLTSDDAAWITGQDIQVAGGYAL